jgi:hypothetical protein
MRFMFPRRGRDGRVGTYRSKLMRVRIHETHHRSRSQKNLGVAGGEKKIVRVLQTSQGGGWTDGGTERG